MVSPSGAKLRTKETNAFQGVEGGGHLNGEALVSHLIHLQVEAALAAKGMQKR